MFDLCILYTNKPKTFLKTLAIGPGLSDYHKLISNFSTIKIETKSFLL